MIERELPERMNNEGIGVNEEKRMRKKKTEGGALLPETKSLCSLRSTPIGVLLLLPNSYTWPATLSHLPVVAAFFILFLFFPVIITLFFSVSSFKQQINFFYKFLKNGEKMLKD